MSNKVGRYRQVGSDKERLKGIVGSGSDNARGSTILSEKTLIVVAGGGIDGIDGLDSVEIYDPSDNTWHSGKKSLSQQFIIPKTKINQNA